MSLPFCARVNRSRGPFLGFELLIAYLLEVIVVHGYLDLVVLPPQKLPLAPGNEM
jgi:hypothetical protein